MQEPKSKNIFPDMPELKNINLTVKVRVQWDGDDEDVGFAMASKLKTSLAWYEDASLEMLSGLVQDWARVTIDRWDGKEAKLSDGRVGSAKTKVRTKVTIEYGDYDIHKTAGLTTGTYQIDYALAHGIRDRMYEFFGDWSWLAYQVTEQVNARAQAGEFITMAADAVRTYINIAEEQRAGNLEIKLNKSGESVN